MKKYSKTLMLTAISACLYIGAINVASAKVCFIVGGCDRDDGQHIGDESCQDLGYTVLASQCIGNTVPYDPCTQGNKTYYRGCKCPDQFKYQEVVGDIYDYINRCTEIGSDGSTDKYERKICETGYNYLEKPKDTIEQARELRSASIAISNYNLNGTAEYCDNNSEPDTRDECVDKYDVTPSITRYKTCACPGNYKYRKISTKGFDARVFEGVNMCKGSNNIEYYESAQCKGAQVGNYFYRSECADDEISEPGSNNVNVKRWTAEYGGSYTECLPCKKICSGMTEATCKTEIAKAENKGKHCKKTGDNCYIMEAGGLCPLPTCPTGSYTTAALCEAAGNSDGCHLSGSCYIPYRCEDVTRVGSTNVTLYSSYEDAVRSNRLVTNVIGGGIAYYGDRNSGSRNCSSCGLSINGNTCYKSTNSCNIGWKVYNVNQKYVLSYSSISELDPYGYCLDANTMLVNTGDDYTYAVSYDEAEDRAEYGNRHLPTVYYMNEINAKLPQIDSLFGWHLNSLQAPGVPLWVEEDATNCFWTKGVNDERIIPYTFDSDDTGKVIADEDGVAIITSRINTVSSDTGEYYYVQLYNLIARIEQNNHLCDNNVFSCNVKHSDGNSDNISQGVTMTIDGYHNIRCGYPYCHFLVIETLQ